MAASDAADVVRSERAIEFRSLVLARWVAVAFLALVAVIFQALRYIDAAWPLLLVCAFAGTYNLLSVATGLLETRPFFVTSTLLTLDVLALTAYLHYSGDIENPLMFGYSLPVVAGAVILSRRSGFLLAGLAAVLFSLLMLLTLVDSMPVHLPHNHLALISALNIDETIDPDLNKEGWHYILAHSFALVAVLFGSAHAFGTLSERIRQKDAQLSRENERMLLLLSILPEGVVLAAKDGTIIWANPSAQRLIPQLEANSSIHALQATLGLGERFADFTGSIEEFESSYGDHTLGHALVRTVSEGRVVWVFRDLTERHKLMAQMIHQSKMVDLGLLAAGIAHEIGNPLSSMSALIQVIDMKQVTPDIAGRLRALGSHIDRISRIVQDITNFARPSAGTRTRVTLQALLDKALQIFRLHEKAQRLKIEVEPMNRPIHVEIVEDQIVQVILNLLLNASDASNQAGTIKVALSHTSEGSKVSITDYGAGMTEEIQRRLFTPFFSTKQQGRGMGLGLWISESIVRAHGGRIEVQSFPGKGSTFSVCLPRTGVY